MFIFSSVSNNLNAVCSALVLYRILNASILIFPSARMCERVIVVTFVCLSVCLSVRLSVCLSLSVADLDCRLLALQRDTNLNRTTI